MSAKLKKIYQTSYIILTQRCQPFQFLRSHTDFQVRFPHYVYEVKNPANKDLKMLQDKIKEVAPPCTPLFSGSDIGLFPFKKKQTGMCVILLKRHKYSM